MVMDIQDFSFFENDIEIYFYNLVLIESLTIGRDVDDTEFLDVTSKFHNTWLSMVKIDTNRTKCVLKSLFDKMSQWFRDRGSRTTMKRFEAGGKILGRYENATIIHENT